MSLWKVKRKFGNVTVTLLIGAQSSGEALDKSLDHPVVKAAREQTVCDEVRVKCVYED